MIIRVLLGLSSKLIDELLHRTPGLGDLPGISVPASSGSLVNLLKILTTGVAIADNKLHLLEASRAAELLGIKLLNCQWNVNYQITSLSPFEELTMLYYIILHNKMIYT